MDGAVKGEMAMTDHKQILPTDLKEFLLSLKEGSKVELKSSSELPKSFWETYSSFSNTDGGLIVLGVKEEEKENTLIGINNPQKALTDLWNLLANDNKVSYRTINNQDVKTIPIDGKTIIVVQVNEAPDNIKPVYINGKIENTYIRTGDGDRKADRNEIAAMLRNAQPGLDALPISDFTMDDLDPQSILSFKQKVSLRYPKKHYMEMDNQKFLTEIGLCRRERGTDKVEVLRGALLCLGKINAIKEQYPHFHVDYFNYRGNNSRWTDRVSDDEPSDYEMNLFNFYTIVDEKLRNLLHESFQLGQNQLRLPVSNFDETLRECLVNCLVHADYEAGYPATKIEAFNGWFSFFNPGKMLISKQQFQLGGDSRPRNEIIMKMFRLLGASERQGFGGSLIYKSAMENDFRLPELESNLEHTEIRVWDIDLGDSYPNLNSDEKEVLRYVSKSGKALSISDICKATSLTYYKVQKAIHVLEEQNVVGKIGNGPATKYALEVGSAEMFTQMQIAMDIIRKNFL